MFKAPKRAKKRKQVLSTVADSSSDEEHGATRASGGQHDDDDADNDGDEAGGIGALAAAQLKIKERKDKQKKKKQRRSGASNGVGGGVSFNSEEHDEEVGDFAGERDRSSSTKDRKKQRKKDDKKKRKKRSGGMGFGGATMAFHGEDEKEASDAAAAGLGASALGKEGDAGDDGTVGGSLYDTTALEALRSKQKVYVAPSGDAGDKKDGIESKSKQDGTPSENKTGADRPGTSTSSNPKNLGLGDGKTSFIPLDGSNIVAGDDALAYMEEEDDEREGMASPEAEAARKRDKSALAGTDRLSNGIGSNSVLGGAGDTIDADIDAGGRQWEEEVARRAGIKGQQDGAQTIASSPAVTVETMRGTISKTLTHLRQRREDLESSYDRRRNELQGVEDELARQKEELRAGGSSFEHYQKLRVDIADWVGALRNLSSKVETITDTIRELEADSAEQRRLRSRQREDDIAAVLQTKGLLDSVIGRQIQQSDDSSAPAVDEFGRDIQSAEALARERRIVRRRRVRKESSVRIEKRQETRQKVQGEIPETAVFVVEDSDADLSDNEVEEQAQRIDALEEALSLAKDELEKPYCSLSALQDLFISWAKHSPEDYRRCYAKLSLVDLAAVLVRCETCTKINILRCATDFGSDNINIVADFDWAVTASSFESSESSQDDKNECNSSSDDEDELVCAISRKVILPYLLLMMGEGADGEQLYDPFSSRQTNMVKGLFLFLKTTLKTSNEVSAIQRSTKSIFDVFKASLENFALLLVKSEALKVLEGKETNSGADDDQQALKEAVTYSIFEQAHRLQKFVGNAAGLSFYFGEESDAQRELASFILIEVVASRLLPVLSLLQKAGTDSNLKAEAILQCVFRDIKTAGWLDDEALMLQTAPIRAAIDKK